MEFIFFDASDGRLFVRSDAESATWTPEEMNLQALFPYDSGRAIQRGQRIGFVDDTGALQPFEIRKVRTYEPDHYQEITAEHIAVSELSDDHVDKAEITDKTAGQALSSLLTGTLWSIGTNTSSGTQTADISRGSVWQAIRTIEQNWNVYIKPRVVFNASGITGRYLDIAPAEPTWRGVRLSLDKNADEMGVTWDDTDVITAIYGYGGTVEGATEGETKIVTFKDVVWAATADHPAKPAGQAYLVDPDATALYGRNGRPRYGYYQNTDIKTGSLLLEKSWEALKNSNAPQVQIDSQVRDLYRMGYADQPLRLHDEVIVEVRPTGETLRQEIVRMTVDLLDPTATRVVIGRYIPNIVYMQRQTNKAARGGGGGGRRGTGGTDEDQNNERYEFETEITANQYQISLRAYQRDMTNVENILKKAGVAIDASGVIIYAGNNLDEMQSNITVNANKIALVVEGTGTNAHIKAAQIVASINESGSTVIISADHVNLDGYVTTSMLEAAFTDVDQISCRDLTVSRYLQVGSHVYSHKSATLHRYSLSNNYRFMLDNGMSISGYLVTSSSSATIDFLGY